MLGLLVWRWHLWHWYDQGRRTLVRGVNGFVFVPRFSVAQMLMLLLLCQDESGWLVLFLSLPLDMHSPARRAWFIPLANGRTSVGVVMNQKIYNEKMKQPAEPTFFLPSSIPNPTKSIMVDRYFCNILLAPGVAKLLDVAVMEVGSVKSATDFSYSAPSYADCGYRIIGDAGGESGVHNPTLPG